MILLTLLLSAGDCHAWGEWLLMSAPDRVLSAAEKVSAKSPPCERYLKASALIAKEKGAEAAKLLDGLLSEPPPLSDYAKLQRARLAFHMDETYTPQPLSVANEEYALLTLLLGDFMYEKVNIAPGPELRRLQLELLAERAEKTKPVWADKVQRELFVDYPDSPRAPLAYPPATLSDLMRRVANAGEKHMNADVLKTVAAARSMQPSEGQLCALGYYEGAAQRKLRKYALAEAALLDATTRCAKQASLVPPGSAEASSLRDFKKRSHFLLGNVQIILRPLATAAATMQRFATEWGNDSLVDDALFGIAVATAKAGLAEDAIKAYERVARLEPPGDMCAEAAFRIAYGHYKAERYEPAAAGFKRISDGTCGADEYERTRGLYWEARTREKQGQKADKLLARVIEVAPLSYYALLARTRLGAKVSTLSKVQPQTLEAEWSDASLSRSRTLSSLGLFKEAQLELLGAENRAPQDALLSVAQALSLAKQHHKASMLFRTALRARLGRAPASATDVAWNIAYPRPFADEIAISEKREGLEPDFLLALIREESAFQLDAGSWANAFGLTQLLVETAELTARDMKRTPMPTAEMLRTDPGLAITLGAHHLAMLKRKHKHPALILAAYNAGPGNVSKWVEARGTKPMDEFVEEIPLDETRGYVKRIMRTWSTYRLLSSKTPPAFDIAPLR
jgi:soluble lytic murein transglycosylase-like protein